jgi:hypothetical protein
MCIAPSGSSEHAPRNGKVNPERVGILGFSAGGNLAAHAVTFAGERTYPTDPKVDSVDPAPNFGVLIYAAYLLEEGKPDNLNPDLKVTGNTPPTFLAVAHDDKRFVEGSARFYIEMFRNERPCELHIFQKGGHGFGFDKTEEEIRQWPALAGAVDEDHGLAQCRLSRVVVSAAIRKLKIACAMIPGLREPLRRWSQQKASPQRNTAPKPCQLWKWSRAKVSEVPIAAIFGPQRSALSPKKRPRKITSSQIGARTAERTKAQKFEKVNRADPDGIASSKVTTSLTNSLDRQTDQSMRHQARKPRTRKENRRPIPVSSFQKGAVF